VHGRSEIVVDEDYEIPNGIDRRNNCAGDRERTTWELWQLASGRAPHDLRLIGVKLKTIRLHPVGDIVDTL